MRPTVYLGMCEPGGPWTARDRGLAEALLAYEAEECSGCGQPRHTAWDPRTEGEWEAERHICEACKAREALTADVKPKPGEHVTVTRVKPTSPAVSASGLDVQVDAAQAQ